MLSREGLFTETLSREGLFAEADRQLSICNACRYCEGFCPVFPSLARFRELDESTVTHLANLCHDCRACYSACMYVAPHEFDLNPPLVFSAVRKDTYARAGGRLGRRLSSPGGVAGTVALFVAVLVVLVGSESGLSVLVHSRPGASSPYRVLSYPSLVVVGLATFGLGLAATLSGARRYWRATGRRLGRGDLVPVLGATWDALTLAQMRGGGAGCAFPGASARGVRRHAHLAVSWGFTLCLVSTISAAVAQDLTGSKPPYPYVSLPVLSGLVGGIGIVAGSLALLGGKRAAPRETTDPQMARADIALILALLCIGTTGIATLLVRTTPAFGIVLVAHLSGVFACFVLAPYSKFVHGLYRGLALFFERAERARPRGS